jgi:hypothetical protein
MARGIRIPSEYSSRLSDISNALEIAGISHGVWNAEAMITPNYNGPIDLECKDLKRWNDFERIVKAFTAPQIHAEGAD